MAEAEPKIEKEENVIMNITINGEELLRKDEDAGAKKKIDLAYFTKEGSRWAVVMPVESHWGIKGDQDTVEQRDVKKRAAELEKCFLDNGYELLYHPKRAEGSAPIYWDEEALNSCGKWLFEKNPLGAAIYMYADGYQQKYAMKDGDSYKALSLGDWIKQFGDTEEYKFSKMHEGVGCPIEISLDINQIPAENIIEELNDKSDKAIKCKGPFRHQPKGTFTIVSEGGVRKKPKTFHQIALDAYSHKDFNSKLMAHWGDLRKRKAGGRFIDNIESTFAYQGGMFHVPYHLPPARIQKVVNDRHIIQIVNLIKRQVDPKVSTNMKEWVALGVCGGHDIKVIHDGDMYVVGYHRLDKLSGNKCWKGFVFNKKAESHQGSLRNIMRSKVPVNEDALKAKTVSNFITACDNK